MKTLARAFVVANLALLAWACPSEPKRDPKAEAEGLYLAGTAAYLQGQFDQALRFFNQVRATHPQDPRLPAAIGEVYLAQGKLPEALKEFEAAAAADPKRATNWSRIGSIQASLGKGDEAKAALRKALGLNPADFNALEELGEIDAKAGEVDSAVGHFVLAAQASPDLGKGRLYLRAAQILTAHHRDADSLRLLQQARALQVRAPELLVELGDQLVKAGDLAPAAQAYREAAGGQKAADPTLWELVGEIEARLDKPADAEEAFHQSLQLKERALPHVALARIYLARQNRQGAQTELELALKAATGEERRETMELAELLVTMGRKADALKILDNLASETESGRDRDLQLRTAKLAKDMGARAIVAAACARVSDAGVRCP